MAREDLIIRLLGDLNLRARPAPASKNTALDKFTLPTETVGLTETATATRKDPGTFKWWGAPDPAFSRPSPAYLANGTQVGSSQPRFEAGKFNQAIMVEEGTPNYILYSQELDNAAWGKESVTVTANAMVAPDGTNTADKVVASGTTGYHDLQQSLGSIASGTTDTLSCHVKKDNTPWFCLGSGLGTNWYRQWFDLDNGVLGSADAGVTGTIKSIGSGWYRVTTTFTHSGAATVRGLLVAPTPANGSINYAQAGESVFVWGAQVEEKPYATSYMATTSAAVTRSPETPTIPTPGVLDFQEGTIELWFKPDAAFWNGSYNRIIGHATSMGYNEIELMRSGSTSKLAFAISNNSRSPANGSWIIVESITQLAVNTWYHLAVIWSVSQGRYALFINGVKEDEAALTSGAVPSVVGTLALGYHPSASDRWANGLIDDLRISSIARTDAEILAAYNSGVALPMDADTTYKLAFDGSLVHEMASSKWTWGAGQWK